METLLFNALLSVFISGGIGGFFTIYNQHRGKVLDKIWEERYVVYAKLWDISKLIPKFPMLKNVTYSQLLYISESLRKWYFEDKGGVLLSNKSKDAYIQLQTQLTSFAKESSSLISINGELSEYFIIQKLFSELRTELTSDLMSRKRGLKLFE